MIEVLVDESGYVIDKEGQRLCDDQGEWILLSEEQITALRSNNMFEEEEFAPKEKNTFNSHY